MIEMQACDRGSEGAKGGATALQSQRKEKLVLETRHNKEPPQSQKPEPPRITSL